MTKTVIPPGRSELTALLHRHPQARGAGLDVPRGAQQLGEIRESARHDPRSQKDDGERGERHQRADGVGQPPSAVQRVRH